jgi:hypothetical protein
MQVHEGHHGAARVAYNGVQVGDETLAIQKPVRGS